MTPGSPHDARLRAQVRPAEWTNPTPPSSAAYDMLVVGGGPAGLVVAAGCAGLGARVALVEKHLLGGDCLNTGCVPSKALLRSAHAAAEVRRSGDLGVRVGGEVTVDFPAVMERMRRLRADIARHDSAQRFSDLGCDVFLGAGAFTAPDTFAIDGRDLRFRRACIATGARAALPPVPGLAQAGALTNETLFDLTELPARLVVLGGGPIGCEMAQAFARFGSAVALLEMAPRLLPVEDPRASELLAAAFQRDGIDVHTGARVEEVRRQAEEIVVTAGGRDLRADALLVAAGRTPNTHDLGLDAAGVAVSQSGHVEVDDRLRTTNPRIYAAGDVCSRLAFTHVADAHARLVVRNALFPGSGRASRQVIPWCTYTEPEVAHVGLRAEEAAARGDVDTLQADLADLDRGVTDGVAGFAAVHVAARSGAILGATVVGPHAGELIAEVATALAAGLDLRAFGDVIRPYPTLAEVFRRLGDARNRERLTPSSRAWLRRWLALWRRLG